MENLSVLGTIASDAAELIVRVKESAAVVVHEARDDIEVRVNNPESWSLKGSKVEQTKVAGGNTISISGGGGISIQGGGSVFVGGIISGDVTIGDDGPSEMNINGRQIMVDGTDVYVDGIKQKDDPSEETGLMASIAKLLRRSASKMTVNNITIEVTDDTIWVNGKKQVPVDKGSVAEGDNVDKPLPKKPPQPDHIEIAVPHNYRGKLDFATGGSKEFSFDGWPGGDVSISVDGSGDGKMTGRVSEAGTVKVSLTSRGAFVFEQPIYCRKFKPTVTGSGNLTFPDVNGEEITLTSTSRGEVNATGPINVSGKADITASGSGDMTFQGLTAKELGLASSSRSTIHVRGALAIAADVDLDLSGSGDLHIGRLNAGSLEMTGNSRGAFNVEGDVTVAGRAKVTLTGSGNAEFRKPMKSAGFAATLTSRGDLSMTRLDTGELNVTATASGSTTIDDGSCTSGELTSTSRGDITLRGGKFKNLRKSKSGSGSIAVEGDRD